MWDVRIIQTIPPHHYELLYFRNSVARFTLEEDDRGSTNLTLKDTGVPAAHRTEVTAGWVSVLMALKAAVDFGIDLRAHDPDRHWDNGYVENKHRWGVADGINAVWAPPSLRQADPPSLGWDSADYYRRRL